MGPMYQLETGESVLVELVNRDSYSSHPNQVACVTNRRLVFVKRKEFAMEPYAIQYYPIDSCTEISYRKVFAIGATITGLIVAAFGVYALYLKFMGNTDLPRMTGLSILMVVGGVGLAIGVKRHKVTFLVGDKRLSWRCSAGEFRESLEPLRNLVDLARKRGIVLTGLSENIYESERSRVD